MITKWQVISTCWTTGPNTLQRPCIRLSKALFFSLILTGGLFFLTPAGMATEKNLPFSPGEELVYAVRWEMIHAGKAWFKVLPLTTVDGGSAYHFSLEVRSSPYIDMLYKIRDRMEGFTNLDFTHSLLYTKTQSGKDKRQVVVEFDRENSTATYSNFGGKRDPIQIPSNTFDPVSAFYKMRVMNFQTNQNISFPVTNGKKYFIQKGRILKKEKLTLPSGTFDTYVLALRVNHFSGVFEKSENPTVKLWVTADNRQIPLKIKIKVFVGSIIFDLIVDNATL